MLQTGEFDYASNLLVEDAVLQRLESGGKGRVITAAGGSFEFIQLNVAAPWTEVDGERASPASRDGRWPAMATRNAVQVADLTVTEETRQLEGLARRLAIALGDPAFRARFRARLEASPFREGKLHLQRTLAADGRAELLALARLNGESESVADSVQRATQALEVYLPVPAHRRAWRGESRLLVATAARDGDIRPRPRCAGD